MWEEGVHAVTFKPDKRNRSQGKSIPRVVCIGSLLGKRIRGSSTLTKPGVDLVLAATCLVLRTAPLLGQD